MTTTVTPINLTTTQLTQLHQAQLKLASQVKHICEKHGLRYFLMAGTLLGAIRHSGFIPWDDDMDIGMPREDYDKFMQIAPQEMGSDFFVQSLQSDPGYGLSFAKIRLNGTSLVEASSAQTSAHKGIYIDIFPLDNMPEQLWLRHWHASLTTILKRAILLHQGYTPWFNSRPMKKFAYQIATPLAKLAPIGILISLLERLMRAFNSRNGEYMTAIGGSYGYFGELVERRWMDALVSLPFEDTAFECLVGSREYLTNLYGDYMTLPTPENRKSRHGIIHLSFHAD